MVRLCGKRGEIIKSGEESLKWTVYVALGETEKREVENGDFMVDEDEKVKKRKKLKKLQEKKAMRAKAMRAKAMREKLCVNAYASGSSSSLNFSSSKKQLFNEKSQKYQKYEKQPPGEGAAKRFKPRKLDEAQIRPFLDHHWIG